MQIKMAIKVSCMCGKTISAKGEFAGRQVKCPACKQLLGIPRPKVEEESYEGTQDWDPLKEHRVPHADHGSNSLLF